MPRSCSAEDIPDRVVAIVLARLGGVEEELVAAGLLDSVKAISLALAIEEEFGLPLEDISVDDMVTLSSLTRKICSAMEQSSTG